MDRFSKYNPKSTFLYFLCVIILTISINHPVYMVVSLLCALFYKIKLCTRGAILYFLKFILPIILFVALFNFAFAHYGNTLLFTVRDIRFTLEALFYGLHQGVMLSGVILWFSAYNEVVTTERFLAVFGNVMPNTALVFSMVLGFIPRLKKNAVEIEDARLLVDNDKSKFKCMLMNFSALVTMALEDSINLAEGMRARGFGGGRRVYSKYKFRFKDLMLLLISLLLTAFIIIEKAVGKIGFIFEPDIYCSGMSALSLAAFTLIMLLPVIIDFTEDMKWHILKQRA